MIVDNARSVKFMRYCICAIMLVIINLRQGAGASSAERVAIFATDL
jgi:hypothetical protein